MNIHIINDFLG